MTQRRPARVGCDAGHHQGGNGTVASRTTRESGRQLPPDHHALYVEGPNRSRNVGRVGRVETPAIADLEDATGGLDISVNEATGYPDRIAIQQPDARLSDRVS